MPTVIIGAGLAGLRTAAELKDRSYPGPVVLVGAEEHPPYDRPPLSSTLLRRLEPVWLADDLSVDWPGVADEVHLGVRATGLTLGETSTIHTDTAGAIPARNIVIATGATAINPWPGTLTLTTLDDAARLREALGRPRMQVVIIGAGWVGVELAHEIHAAGHTVTLVEASAHPLVAHLGEVAEHLRGWLSGVDLRTGAQVTGVDLEAGGPGGTVRTTTGPLSADIIITAVGMRPATGWLAGTGIETDSRGFIPVTGSGRVTTQAGRVWAVGGGAHHTHPVFGQVPGGHWFSALRDPARVAADITGSDLPSPQAPEVFSNQGEHHVEVLGALAGDETVLRGDTTTGSWVLFHLRAGRLIGAVVANSPRDTSSIRRALARPEPIEVGPGELADTSVPLRRLLKR